MKPGVQASFARRPHPSRGPSTEPARRSGPDTDGAPVGVPLFLKSLPAVLSTPRPFAVVGDGSGAGGEDPAVVEPVEANLRLTNTSQAPTTTASTAPVAIPAPITLPVSVARPGAPAPIVDRADGDAEATEEAEREPAPLADDSSRIAAAAAGEDESGKVGAGDSGAAGSGPPAEGPVGRGTDAAGSSAAPPDTPRASGTGDGGPAGGGAAAPPPRGRITGRRGLVAREAVARFTGDPEDALDLAARSAGEPLPPAVAARYARMFGHPLGHVRTHVDGAARAAADRLAARGFAIGHHVFLLSPDDVTNRAVSPLLAHELAHVVQHDRRRFDDSGLRVSQPDDPVELEAEALGAAALTRAPQRLETALAPAEGAAAVAGATVSAPAPATSWRASPVLRNAQGFLADNRLDVVGIVQNGTSVSIPLTLTPEQAARLLADQDSPDRLARDIEATLQPAGRARLESAAFLSSRAISARVEADLPAWMGGRGLVSTVDFLDLRERTLRSLRFLEPLERYLQGQGIEPGTIDWVATVPGLLAAPPDHEAVSLVGASLQDRYHLFLRALEAEAQSRPAVVGAATPATLGATLRTYAEALPTETFGDALSVFSEAFLAHWALQMRALVYVPAGFDITRFDPAGAAADLERQRRRVLDDFQRTRAPNLMVQYVRDNWAVSGQTEEGYLAHLDLQRVRAEVVRQMVADFMNQARTDPDYLAALQTAARQQALYSSLRTLVFYSHAMETANADLVESLTFTSSLDDVEDWERQIAQDPYAYYQICDAISRFTTGVLGAVQSGAALAGVFAGLAATPETRAFGMVVSVVALVSHINAMHDLRDQQLTESRADIAAELDLTYDDVVRIVQTMWDDAEAFINGPYIRKLKEVALRMVSANYDELNHWLQNWDDQTPRLVATYRITAWALNNIAGRLESGEVSVVELQGNLMTLEDAPRLRDGATAMQALANRLASPEGAEEKKQELTDAVNAFGAVRRRIENGDYPAWSWGPAVATVARAELGIGEFPEYATFGQVLTGQVEASANPFIARAIAGWRFREIVAEELWQIAKAFALGLLTVASILAPGVGALILTALDIIVNAVAAAFRLGDAYAALDLALLDPHMELQGMTVEQARAALHDAKVGLILSIVIPIGLAALLGLLIWRGSRGISQFADLEHLANAMRTDPITTERLLGLVDDPAELNRLIGLAGEARRLDGIILFSGDVGIATRLLDTIPDATRLATWLEDAGSGQRLLNLVDRVPNVEALEGLISTYGDDFTLLESHLMPLGTDAEASVRLGTLLDRFGGAGALARAVDRCEDIAQLERLAGTVAETERLTNLLEQVQGGRNLESLLGSASLEQLDALLAYDLPPVNLVAYVDAAGGGQSLLSILGHVPSVDVLDALAITYQNDLVALEVDLGALGPGPAAAGRLQAMLAVTGDVGTMRRLLDYCVDLPELEDVLRGIPNVEEVEPLLQQLGGARTSALIEHVGGGAVEIQTFLASVGDANGQAAFLAAMDADPAGVIALGRALEGTPGLAGRLAQHLGGGVAGAVVPEGGLVTISGELAIAPRTLQAMTDADLGALLRVCENPAAPEAAADLARFEGNPIRFRFRSRVAARVEPWVANMLGELGIGAEAPEAAIFRDMSDADQEGLYLISGEGTRGANPRLRPQAARWALGRGPASARQFVFDFQFYVGEVDATQLATKERLAGEIDAEIARMETAHGGRPLTPAQRQAVTRRFTGRSVPAGGIGREIANLDNATGKRALRDFALEQMSVEGPGGVTAGAASADVSHAASLTNLAGDFAPGATALGAVDETNVAAHVQASADSINFADVNEAAYHAHVHNAEIPASDAVAGPNEVARYLNSARETVRSGTASAPRLMQNGNWSVSFSRGAGTTIVGVTPAGDASITTFIPAL